MNILQQLQSLRTQLRETDAALEQIILSLQENQQPAIPNVQQRPYERIYPLTTEPFVFKGKKPTGILFGQRKRMDIHTWRKLTEEILADCNNNPDKHAELMKLRGKIGGRDRVFLANAKDGMRSPLQIDRNLFMETHYDTETLLRILTTRILDAVGYDYSNISVAVRND